MSVKSTAGLSGIAAVIWAIVTVWTDGGDSDSITGAIMLAPFFFALFFFTMLATNRLTSRLSDMAGARRAANAPPRGPAAVEPTSERVEHNQRRRERQRTDRRRR